MFMLIERKLKNSTILTLLRDFLVKVISRYIKIHYEKYQNVNVNLAFY